MCSVSVCRMGSKWVRTTHCTCRTPLMKHQGSTSVRWLFPPCPPCTPAAPSTSSSKVSPSSAAAHQETSPRPFDIKHGWNHFIPTCSLCVEKSSCGKSRGRKVKIPKVERQKVEVNKQCCFYNGQWNVSILTFSGLCIFILRQVRIFVVWLFEWTTSAATPFL